MRSLITIFLISVAALASAQSPLFYAFGNMPVRTIVSANTYDITISGLAGGYNQYPDANFEATEIAPGFVVWPAGGCIRLEVTQVISTFPLVIRVVDAAASGALDGSDLLNARVLILEESKWGTFNIGAFGNLADGNAGSQAGIGPYDFACIQNYYKQQTAAALQSLGTNSHAAVTVTDNARIDLTLTGQNITADLAQNSATTGQFLQWNGTAWVPSDGLKMKEQFFTAVLGQTDFTLTGYTPVAQTGDNYPVKVYRNGVKLRYVASTPGAFQFTYAGATITTAASAAGDEVNIEFNN
jgi:hypothetical protein